MMPHRFSLPHAGKHAAAWVLLFSMLTLTACSEPPKPAATPSLTVETVASSTREVAREVAASGEIAAWEEVSVGVELSGLRVSEVAVEVGDAVRRGELLLRLDDRTLRSQLTQSDASVERARANAEVASRRAKRIRELAVQKFVAAQDAEQAEAEATSAQAQLRTERAARDSTNVQLGFTTVRAPVDGLVSARSVQPGQVASGGELLRLIRDGRLEWRAELAESDLIRVVPGMSVRLTGPGGAVIEGRVRQVSPALDPLRRTGSVYIDLPQPGSLRAGMFAAGHFMLGRADALVVPLEAIVRRDGRAYAFVVDGAQRVRERRLETGATTGTEIEVTAGLRAGERVVARGAGFLRDGDLVRVVATKPAPARTGNAARAR